MPRPPLRFLAAAILVGCDQTRHPLGPAESVSLALSQEERTRVIRVDDQLTYFEACFGENVFVRFRYQIITFFRGEVTHGHSRFNVVQKGSTVTGLTSGTVWQLRGTQVVGANGDFTTGDAPGEFTLLLNHIFIGPVTAPRLRFQERRHITITRDGTVRVDRARIKVVCQNEAL